MTPSSYAHGYRRGQQDALERLRDQINQQFPKPTLGIQKVLGLIDTAITETENPAHV